jgi:gluconate kinase
MPLIILFGPTGAGKTYIGRLLAKKFGYYFYDGDADLTAEMKQALNSMRVITDKMRQKFITRLINSAVKLAKQNPKLAVAQTFIKDKYRRRLLKKLPLAKFILVNTKTALRYRRRRRRADYPWDENYVQAMDALFEPPTIPCLTLTNDNNGTKKLLPALRRLLSQLS